MCTILHGDIVVRNVIETSEGSKRNGEKDRVFKPSEWVQLIREIDVVNPFKMFYVEHHLTENLVGDGTPLVKVGNYEHAYEQYLRPPNGIAVIRGLLF